MGVTYYRVLQVSELSPRIVVRVQRYTPTDNEAGTTGLYLKRVGDTSEFAFYSALEVRGQYYTFQFDSLLFEREAGRYVGRVVVEGLTCGNVQIQLHKDAKVTFAESQQAVTCEEC